MGQVGISTPLTESVAFGWKQLTGGYAETTHLLLR